MVSVHLIYHPVYAEHKGQMGLEGSYWGVRVGVSLQHSGFVTQLKVFKGSELMQGSFEPETQIN